IEVWADIFRAGHDIAATVLLWRLETEPDWSRTPMAHYGNDRWTATFTPTIVGRYVYAIEAWTDEFATWRHGTLAKMNAGQDVTLDALEGAAMMTKAQPQDEASAKIISAACEAFLQDGEISPLLAENVEHAMAQSQVRSDLTTSQLFPLMIDRARAVA